MVSKVKTPCIGVCSTGIGDSVCRGCKRFSHEIVGWNGYNEGHKLSVLNRLDSLLEQVLVPKIEVFDQALLKQQLDTQGVRYHTQQSHYSWVFDLIRAGASQLSSLEPYGARVQRDYQQFSMSELKRQIEEDFFVLSSVHYERYFQLNR